MLSLNATDFDENLFININAAICCALFLFIAVPSLILFILCTIAIVSDEVINWHLKYVLLNIFAAEICFSLSLNIHFLGYPARAFFDIPGNIEICKINLGLGIIGNTTKVTSITLYAIMVYIFIKYSTKKVKWYVIIPSTIVFWMISVIFAIPVLVSKHDDGKDHILLNGFCTIDVMQRFSHSEQIQFAAQVIVASVVEIFGCGSILVTFGSLIYCYIKKMFSQQKQTSKKQSLKICSILE